MTHEAETGLFGHYHGHVVWWNPLFHHPR